MSGLPPEAKQEAYRIQGEIAKDTAEGVAHFVEWAGKSAFNAAMEVSRERNRRAWVTYGTDEMRDQAIDEWKQEIVENRYQSDLFWMQAVRAWDNPGQAMGDINELMVRDPRTAREVMWGTTAEVVGTIAAIEGAVGMTRLAVGAGAAGESAAATSGLRRPGINLLRPRAAALSAEDVVAIQARRAARLAAQEASASAEGQAAAPVSGAATPLVGTQNPTTAWAAKTGRAYDRRVTRFWRRYEGQTVGDWTVESVNRRLAPGVQPDLVLVNQSTKTIVIHDVTSKAASSHLAKGAGYRKYFEAQRPGYAVTYGEGYWEGLENSWEALSKKGELYFPGQTRPPGTP